jgi:hypothetical protein
MIGFLFLVVYSCSLLYLVVWINKAVSKFSYCSDVDLEKVPSPSVLSVIVLVPMPLHFFALICWGLTDNPYHRNGVEPWIHAGDDLAMLVFLLVGFCLVSAGWVLSQAGSLSATLRLRREATRERKMQRERDEFIERVRTGMPKTD